MLKKVFALLLTIYSTFSFGQITINHSGPLKELLVLIETKYGYKFMYSNDDINILQNISVNFENSNLETVLKEISEKSNLTYKTLNKQIILKSKIKENKPVSGINKTPEKETDLPSEQKPRQNVNNYQHADKPPLNENISINSIKTDIESKNQQKKQSSGYKPDSIITDLIIRNNINETTAIDSSKNDNITKTIDEDDNITQKSAEKSNLKEKYKNLNNNRFPKYSLHSNLLYYLVVTPNLGFEIKFNENISILVNGSWMNMNWKNGDKCYRIWTIMPEIRYYFSKNKKLYSGIMPYAGQINLKLKETGSQGDLFGGGLTFGYIAEINKNLKLDLGIAFGYTNYKYSTYNYIDGINFKKDSGVKNLWIPVKIGVSIVWEIN